MPIKFFFIGLLIYACQAIAAQSMSSDKAWDLLLNDVKIRYFYSFTYDALLPKPRFGSELKKLDGQIITIKGFYLPVDVTGNVMVLSYHPMNMCFFCTGEGLQTIVELIPAVGEVSRLNRLKTDDYFKVKGRLRLNSDSFEHLFYILDEVVLVKVVK
ncbi:MAG: hypothetical protein LC643_01730 [Bacteroidales bacterium]|nr:hypothetical protein [Bacteroidales bacterium]